jgi:hypothetical protein
VNLIVTVLSAIGIALLVWIAVGHQQDAREAGAAFVAAIKEQTPPSVSRSSSCARPTACRAIRARRREGVVLQAGRALNLSPNFTLEELTHSDIARAAASTTRRRPTCCRAS